MGVYYRLGGLPSSERKGGAVGNIAWTVTGSQGVLEGMGLCWIARWAYGPWLTLAEVYGMKWDVLVGLGVALGVWGTAAGAAEQVPSAELLAKLAEQEAHLSKVMKSGAYLIHSETEELDGDGKRLHTRQSLVRVSQVEGKKTLDIQKVLKDGQDVTTEAKIRKPDKERDMQSPFAAAVQPRYRFTLQGADTTSPSLLRLHFEPKVPSTDTYVGEAVVDPSAGEVVWIHQKPAQNPAFVDRLEFEAQVSTPTAMGRQLTSLRVEGVAGVLFYKRGFKVKVAFSEYDVGSAQAEK